MLVKPAQALFGEPWLAFNRVLTYQVLKWRLRDRANRAAYVPEPGSMLYVAASSLPYHTSGYTNRTHEVICALQAAGANVHVLTRPGYPADRKDRQQDAAGDETLIGGVRYQHLTRPFNNRPVLQYALQAAAVVAELAARRRVALIHAASNHVNALPALLAARHLGIPFQYEMRGLWELTRISRTPSYLGSQAYKQGLQLEGLVARQADRLFVISEQLGRYVRDAWGVATERMALLPNCVDPDRILPADPSCIEPDTLGYAGSLIGYEGLDTLIDAVALLVVVAGRRIAVHVIGDGEARAQLEGQVGRLGLSGVIRFHGKVPPEAAREMLGRCAMVCIPRKPFQVCEIVPPIKLVEALAMGKPVIVPDLPVFRDEMGNNPAGWFFKAGDAKDLARVIDGALADRAALVVLGARAREYASRRRCWRDFIIGALPVAQNRELNGRQGY